MDTPDRRSFLFGGASVLASPFFCSSLDAAPGAVGVWDGRAPLPFGLHSHAATAFTLVRQDRDKPIASSVLVCIGGETDRARGSDNVSDAVVIYDHQTNLWSLGPSLPAPRRHLSTTFLNGYLFAFGGFGAAASGRCRMERDVWRLADLGPKTRWRAMAPLPAPLALFACASVNGEAIVSGGRTPRGSRNSSWSDHTASDRTWAYDAARDRWEARAPMPTMRYAAAGVSLGGRLIVIGGRTESDANTPAVEAYDPYFDRWFELAPLPTTKGQPAPRGQSALAAAVWSDKIYAMGGEWIDAAAGRRGVYGDVWEYDPFADSWRAIAAMPHPRSGFGAVGLKDGVYVCGGMLGASRQPTAFLDRLTLR